MLAMPSLDQLREQLQTRPDFGRFATHSIIDDVLPCNTFRRGSLIELFGNGTNLAAIIGRESLRDGGSLVVVDAENRFYPPAVAAMGIDLDRLIVIRGDDWIVNQALGCPAIDAVLCWPQKLDTKMFRRWQLAAERGGSIGLLVRPSSARGSPSWADVQIVIEQVSSRWRIDILGRTVEFTIEEGHIHDSRDSLPESRHA